jgi:drug/metabolite transporter (DMT)-like permease
MPANASVVLALFTVVAVLCGVGAAWLVGPRRAPAAVIPAVCAFLALYWVGHRSGLELGPTVELAGFRVALVQDVLAGALGALAGAVGQRWVLHRRHARRDPGSQVR